MREIIEEEFERLKKDLDSGNINMDKSNNYMIEHNYNDEYSLNDIADAQEIFKQKAISFLSKDYNGKYIILSGWCVHVISIGFYKKNKLKNGVLCK